MLITAMMITAANEDGSRSCEESSLPVR